jgi:hypothetical protein
LLLFAKTHANWNACFCNGQVDALRDGDLLQRRSQELVVFEESNALFVVLLLRKQMDLVLHDVVQHANLVFVRRDFFRDGQVVHFEQAHQIFIGPAGPVVARDHQVTRVRHSPVGHLLVARLFLFPQNPFS